MSDADADAGAEPDVDTVDTVPQVFVVLDAVDPGRVAEFWVAALRYRRADPIEQYQVLVPPSGHHGSLVLIQGVPEAKRGKNRMHLDLHVDDPEAEVARLEALGARRLGRGSVGPFSWMTMADPEGNEFCVGAR